MTRVEIHGGLNEIGGNKFLVEAGDSCVLLDFGKSFGGEDSFFDFPLYTPSCREDLVRTGILPRIEGLYRNENVRVAYGDTEPLRVEEDPDPGCDVDALLLSHAHQDHCGYVGLLRRDIPVITGALTRRFMALREEQQNASFTDVGSFDHFGAIDVGETRWVGDIEVSYHPVDHSIVGAGAFILDAGGSRVAFTGDLRFHGYRGDQTEAFLDALQREHVDVLLCEGTRVAGASSKPAPGDEAAERHAVKSEEAVYEEALHLAEDTEGLVVYDGSPADLDRVRTLHRVAEASGRRLLVGVRHAHLLMNLDDVEGLPSIEDVGVFLPRAKYNSRRNAYEELVQGREGVYVETFTGTRYGIARDVVEDERVAQEDIVWGPHRRQRVVENGGAYLLYVTSGIQALMQFKPVEGKIPGTYVYGKAEPFTEEMELSFEKIENWVELCGLDWAWAHTSGHAGTRGIRRVVDAADADVLVPIHTENASVMADWVGEKRSVTWPMDVEAPVSFSVG